MELYHHGILGMKWGVRRWQNLDGTLTQAGKDRLRQAVNKYNETGQGKVMHPRDTRSFRMDSRELKQEYIAEDMARRGYDWVNYILDRNGRAVGIYDQDRQYVMLENGKEWLEAHKDELFTRIDDLTIDYNSLPNSQKKKKNK